MTVPQSMQVTVLEEAGYKWAMISISLNYLQPVENMHDVALKLVKLGEPHCKFLRQMKLWVSMTAPWYFWKHFQTYNVGVDWPDFGSTSTMNKIMSRPLVQDDFGGCIDDSMLNLLNWYIEGKDFRKVIAHIPGAYLYTRVLCMNYSALRNIIRQRKNHKLEEWEIFISEILEQVEYPQFLDL